MLGWEYPPILNGGLGIACYGLTQELKESVHLTLIVPQADPTFGIHKMNLIGLNTHPIISELTKIRNEHRNNENTFRVEQQLYPYENTATSLTKKTSFGENVFLKEKAKITSSFDLNLGSLYDGVYDKVMDFATCSSIIASDHSFDIIHAHDWMTFPAAVQLKERYNKPLVLHVHSLETDRSGEHSRGGTYTIEQKAMEIADVVVPVSHYTGEMIHKHYAIPNHKIFPIHNGVERIKPFKTTKKIKEKVVLFLGRVTFQKGPEYYLEVAKKVIKTFPDVRFVMAGTGDKLQGLIESGAYEGIGSKFHFTGFLTRQQVYSMLSMSDVYFMPSVSEPFGLSALEAAQFGVPCVISKQSGVAEVLKSSLKADFWDIHKMANHIISLLKYDTLKEEVVKNAHKDLAAANWRNAAQKTLNIYNLLLNN